MISDPINIYGLDFFVANHFAISNEPVFVTISNPDYPDHMSIIGLTISMGEIGFQIVRSGDGVTMGYYIIKIDNVVSKEEFMDHLILNYPGYMEWLLFHPEWL